MRRGRPASGTRRTIGPVTVPAVAIALLAGLLTATPAPAQPAATADEAARNAGRRLFQEGRDRHGTPLRASVGSGVTLEGEQLACARCHGADGAGAREGGITAPPLLWSALTQARPASPGLLPRPAYGDADLLRALRLGVAPDGRPLSSVMPRFSLTPRDEVDLLAHLRSLDTGGSPDPGIHEDRIVLGGVLPLSGPLAAAGRAADAAVRACLADTNRQGGVFGRRIDWLVLDAARTPPTEIARQLGSDTLAVIAPWWGELSSAELVERLPGLPLIGPLGPATELDAPQPGLYAVAPQLSQQVRVLVDAFATGEIGAPVPVHDRDLRLAVIASPARHHRAASLALLRQAQNHPRLQVEAWQPALGRSDAAQLDDALRWLRSRADRPDAVLVLGPAGWMAGIGQASGAPSGEPAPLLLGAFNELGLAVLDWPPELRERLRLAHHRNDDNPPDPSLLRDALARIDAPLIQPAVQSLAHAAACLGVEALRRSGRLPSRHKLREGLEAVRDFRTGLVGPLNYGRNQRIGQLGSSIVRIAPDAQSLYTVRLWQSPSSW